MKRVAYLAFVLSAVIGFGNAVHSQVESKTERKWGHSRHGTQFDEGPRSKPWVMEGIGNTSFPITSSNPEVQQWFDQGNTLLYGFWEFEAERAFRWCLKLDPDCAMAYWGLARCPYADKERAQLFLAEAVKRKANVTPRERAYIEVWEAKYKITDESEDETDLQKQQREATKNTYIRKFDQLLIDYPNDIEARVLYWAEMLITTRNFDPAEEDVHPMRYALDRVLQEVLDQDPNHVGALHFRIHNWDGNEGSYALDACLRLSKIAHKSGHLLHMPGHVLGSVGLWNEAAIAMDAATRTEKEYMQRQMILPEQNWNYIHNLNYLAYIQEQLGMYDAALISCKQMLSGPAYNETPDRGNYGNWALVRLLVKYEKWEAILDPDSHLFRLDSNDQIAPALKLYAMTHALIGLGRLEEAENKLQEIESRLAVLTLPKQINELSADWFDDETDGDDASETWFSGKGEEKIAIWHWELHGKLAFAKGNHKKGIKLLKKGARRQYDFWHNDPPKDAVFLYNTLGEFYLASNEFVEAAAAFEKTLEKIDNDGFALSGLVVAYQKLDQPRKARECMGRLLAVWKNADQPNRWLKRAVATGVVATPARNELLAERDYKETVLDKLGHSIWTPPVAPKLVAINVDGDEVSLDDYQGKNVILIFYLGGECVHCMEQMKLANSLCKDFNELDTEIIAVSKDDLATIKRYSEADDFAITLLSDTEFANARRFNSFDDFEEIELHSTILIDRNGKIHWSRHGGAPFMDFDFLKSEISQLNDRFNKTETEK